MSSHELRWIATALALVALAMWLAAFQLRRSVKSAPTMAESPMPPSLFDAIDDALAKMEVGNIAFNSPGLMTLDETVKIELWLDLQLPPTKLVKLIKSGGKVHFARIKISNRMTANLSSPFFEITGNTAATQAVSGKEPTFWIWTVKPKVPGVCVLYLVLDADIVVDGVRSSRSIRSFERSIRVTVTPIQRIEGFVSTNWKWLITTIVIPVVAWWFAHRH